MELSFVSNSGEHRIKIYVVHMGKNIRLMTEIEVKYYFDPLLYMN